MDRKKKTPPRVNAPDRIGTSIKPIIQMSGQSYTTPVATGQRNHPIQKVISSSEKASPQVNSTNVRQQSPKTSDAVRQPLNQTPGNALRQQVNETPISSNSQRHYLTPGSGYEDYSTPSQQDYTTPNSSRHQDNYSFNDIYEQQVQGQVNPSTSQTVNEALHAVAHNIEKLRGLQNQVEVRIQQVQEDIDGVRNRAEEALLLPQQQEIRIDLVQQLKEIKTLEDDLQEQRLMMKLVERQMLEHIQNQKELKLAECNFQMKKRKFESELQKNREDFQKQQRYRDESYQQQLQKMGQENDTVGEIVNTMPEVSDIERMAEKAVAAEESAAAAESPVRDTVNRKKAEGIPKVRFREDDNEMSK